MTLASLPPFFCFSFPILSFLDFFANFPLFKTCSFPAASFGSSPPFLQYNMYKILIQQNICHGFFCIVIFYKLLVFLYAIISIIFRLQALKSHYINNVNQSAYYLIGTCLPAMHIPFSALFISWMSSIPAHQVPTVLQVPIQVTQHKDDTNPSCISSVLFRVLVIILHSSHPTQG